MPPLIATPRYRGSSDPDGAPTRLARLLWVSALCSLTAFSFFLPRGASAEEEFDVSVAAGHVVVVAAKGKWHINKEYPWRLLAGGEKIGREHFRLSEKSAQVDSPKGVVTIRGGVCNGEQCLRIEKSVTVP